MKIVLLIVFYFLSLPLIHAAPEHACGFDAKHINEKPNMWPFENYGKVFNVDDNNQRFVFIKNTVYDEKDHQKVIGRARNCVYWSKDTIFMHKNPIKDFSSIKTPVIIRFFVGNPKEAEKMSRGDDFISNKATIFLDAKNTVGIKTGEKEVVGLFTPDSTTSGTLLIQSKSVKVKTTWRFPKISTKRAVTANALNQGYWSARIIGSESGDKFVAEHIELTSLADPRKSEDPKLPRLLVIGDSISMNYGNAAKEALKGVVNYHRNEGNSFSSNYGTQYADYWLGNYTQKGFQWDVIHFNHGLHDLKQSGPGAPYATPLEKYKAYLRTEIEILKKTGATLVFCTTTPVPNNSGGAYGRQKGAEVAFNKAALEVMKDYPDIQINNLCKVVNDSPVFDKFKTGSDVHYYKEEEQKVLGNAVANAVKKALQSKKQNDL
ncbi:MAG: SGNH/GDSL hydrolase family protein [Akkermansiaceae bacterium]|nr:SGNH/GDSL hydrolase family protein [Akkermansiaceae bacterium]